MEFRPLNDLPIINGIKTRFGSFAARARFGLVIVLVSSLLSASAIADSHSERVDRVKAAFVLNIARFVSWPPEAFESHDERLLLCLYRSNPINQAVEMIQGEMVAGRRVSITRVENLAESGSCHILLVAHDELKSYGKETRPGSARPLLTIADLTGTDTSPRSGRDIMISLVRNDKRIGFEINLDKSRQAGLKMSSQLLKLATIVGDNP